MSIKHDYGRLLTFIVLLIVSSSTAIAQELMKVTGLVVDQNAEPLIGVTVKVKGERQKRHCHRIGWRLLHHGTKGENLGFLLSRLSD